MPKKPTDPKQPKISFVLAKKTPPPISIPSPQRKSVNDLTDDFELLNNRRITRSSSNLSVPPEFSNLLTQKRSASLDNKMAGKGNAVKDIEKEKGSSKVGPKADSVVTQAVDQTVDLATKAVDQTVDSDTLIQDPGEVVQPSNLEIMAMLQSMKLNFTSEIKTELTDFRTEALSSMSALKANIQVLGESQKSIEGRIDAMETGQGTLAKEVKEMRAELNETKRDLAEHRNLTGSNINEIAKNMKAATERVSLDENLQKAINKAAKDIVIQGYKPDKSLSALDAGKKFLYEVMGKSSKEIDNLELLSVSFTRTDSDYPSGVLTFKNESSATNLLKDKKTVSYTHLTLPTICSV